MLRTVCGGAAGRGGCGRCAWRVMRGCVCCCWGKAQRRSRRDEGPETPRRRAAPRRPPGGVAALRRCASRCGATVTGCLSDEVRAGWDGRRTVIDSEPTLPQLQRYTGRNSAHISVHCCLLHHGSNRSKSEEVRTTSERGRGNADGLCGMFDGSSQCTIVLPVECLGYGLGIVVPFLAQVRPFWLRIMKIGGGSGIFLHPGRPDHH